MKISLSKSLLLRLPLLVVLGVTSPILVGIVIGTSRVGDIIQENAEEKLALEAKSLANTVSRWNQMNVLALKNMSKQPGIISMNPQQQQAILEGVANTYEHFYLVQTTNLAGQNIARNDNKPLVNYSDRDWFLGSKAGNDITYQTLIGRTSKQPAVCLATPIRQNLSINLGVAAICSNLTEIAGQVGATRVGETGYAFVVDNLGQIIAHPDTKLTSGDELTNYSDYPPIKNLLAGNNGYFTFQDDNGISWVSQGKSLDNGWKVLILQQQKEAFLAQQQLQQIAIAVGSITILLVGFITWLVALRFIKPLQELTVVADKISEGNLDQRIAIDSEDELGMLASSFNKMAEQLQKSFVNLEDQMQQHTGELHELLDSQSLAKEQLQKRVRELKSELEAISRGNLTATARVTGDEIGEVANFYNNLLDNLRRLIAQVKNISETVTITTSRNEEEIAKLSSTTGLQQEEITGVLVQMETMTQSIQSIAAKTQQAETKIKKATEKVNKEDILLEQAVAKIVALGETTTTTTEQVKGLGKASRKIAKAVDLIRKIALQTNVLAVNASIEAARAGEEGVGFKVVANEVQTLAAQSAQIATDIEKLVLDIQTETSKVVTTMENSSKEVIAGSKLMKDSRDSLLNITNASLEIDNLVEAISKLIAEQSRTTATITTTIQEIAVISGDTSSTATKVSHSFKELLEASQQLQNSVGQFKVS